MQADAPLVTVVVPAWNAQATLDETLGSVAAQTYPNLEIIVVDDGSTDRTAPIAADFCSGEPRARLIAKDNGGVASARNCGIEAAGGEWIAPIDADDLWHPTKIEKQVRAALAASQPPGFVYCWYQSIDEQGHVLGSGPRWAIDGPALKQLAYCNPVRNGSALLLSRTAALSVGGYDPGLRALAAEGCEDVMIQLQIARDHAVALVPEHLVGYRRRASSMSSDTAQIIRSWRLVYERLCAEGAEIPPNVLRWIEGFCRISVAADRAASGSYRHALGPLLGALRRDPVRCSSSGRSCRWGSGRVGTRPDTSPRAAPEAHIRYSTSPRGDCLRTRCAACAQHGGPDSRGPFGACANRTPGRAAVRNSSSCARGDTAGLS